MWFHAVLIVSKCAASNGTTLFFHVFPPLLSLSSSVTGMGGNTRVSFLFIPFIVFSVFELPIHFLWAGVRFFLTSLSHFLLHPRTRRLRAVTAGQHRRHVIRRANYAVTLVFCVLDLVRVVGFIGALIFLFRIERRIRLLDAAILGANSAVNAGTAHPLSDVSGLATARSTPPAPAPII